MTHEIALAIIAALIITAAAPFIIGWVVVLVMSWFDRGSD